MVTHILKRLITNNKKKSILNLLKDSYLESHFTAEKFHVHFRNFKPSCAFHSSLNYSASNKSQSQSQSKKTVNSKSSVDSAADKKASALNEAILQMQKQFGSGSIFYLGRSDTCLNVPVISSGSISLDSALGVGGYARGRVVEIFGPEASGKTTLSLHAIAESQKDNGSCVFIDAEHALDAKFAEKIGVNIKNLLIAQPDNGEQALGMVDCLIRSGTIDVIVVDSVAALVPKAEMDGEVGDSHMALQARLMGQTLRKIAHALNASKTLLIFTNQVRSKLQSFGAFNGPAEVTSGGNALKFYASVRLNIRRIGQVKRGEEIIGNTVRVKVAKNKLAPPFQTVEFDIEFNHGISKEGEMIDIGLREKVFAKSGAWFSYNSSNFAQGREKAKEYLRENAVFAKEVYEKIKGKMKKEGEGMRGESGEDEEMEEETEVFVEGEGEDDSIDR